MGGKITVIGSYMADVTMYVDEFPRAADAVFATHSKVSSGGKGSNQAVAAHRLGADVFFVAKLGMDIFADMALDFYRKEGMSTQYISRTERSHTGIAGITVNNKTGENKIALDPGANMLLSKEDVYNAEKIISESDILLMQNEIPTDALYAALELAKKYGIPTVFDPAPAKEIPVDILKAATYITPNQAEAEFYFGYPADTLKNATSVVKLMYFSGYRNPIITAGSEGAVYWGDHGYNIVKGIKCNAVDTTGAGDAFNGALAVALAEGMIVTDALEFANAAASISVTRYGAASSMPNRMDVDDVYLHFYGKDY
ncbi:MAG: ribokinase [Clostridia bacterium]|nr:ribokinase [Clostridia bacterium]